jgi:succinate dehydrogenase flavin-adding protein (antitoxin of CptAB toxin-antitoxin module)
VLFNIFINYIFYFISDSSLYNYADDNTLSYSGYELDKIINTLEKDSLNLIDWFTSNQMKTNPDKYQAIAIGKNTQSKKAQALKLIFGIRFCKYLATYLMLFLI